MQELSLAEIGIAGEKHIESWLKGNGFTNLKKHSIDGEKTEIEADGKIENILVHILPFPANNPASRLNDDERTRFIIRAAKMHRVAYLASLGIDEEKELAGEITWEKLRLLD